MNDDELKALRERVEELEKRLDAVAMMMNRMRAILKVPLDMQQALMEMQAEAEQAAAATAGADGGKAN